ncbi:MAG: beta-glycosidase [Dysgonamonadaceae bacterium]|jgi:glucosylceramidase|nr:beta-glycosidase [Dysgonamonadaceae bacterium]
MKKILFYFVVLFALVSCDKKPAVEWVTTTPDSVWELQSADSVVFVNNAVVDLEVCINTVQQTIDGFGTCFNELGWTSLSFLNESDRKDIFKELFEPNTGGNLRICRMPVGANDFSRDWYSYDETEGDFELKDFSIDNDKETLIPFIQAALKYNPELKIWASPWSPPSWLKDNKHYACQPLEVGFFHSIGEGGNGIRPDQIRHEEYNMFIQEDTYFKTYANYFAKFIEAYRENGINIFMVMPQNEFNSCQPFPSCTWQASALNKFIGEYLGPKMKELGVEVAFGTMERPTSALADTSLLDAKSSRYLTGAGFQWAGKHAIGDIHRKYPNLKLYQTEQECGNGKNDWRGASYSYDLMALFLNNGVSVYDYWNTSLKDGGMSRWGWTQNSLVTVDTTHNTYKYTYEYYVLKHASHYILSGAKKLAVGGATGGSFGGALENTLAFRNTDGSYVLLLRNKAKESVKPVIKVGAYTFSSVLKPNSINTIVLR